MDEYRWNYHVPAFGSWDYGEDNLPYTQCFESARQVAAVLGRHGSYNAADYGHQDKDLYVAGHDLYQNDVVAPAVIVVARRRRKGGYQNVKGARKHQEMQKQEWRGFEYSEYEVKEPPSPVVSPPKSTAYKYKQPKAVDEDLYKIPPEFLHVKPRKKRGFGLFSSCLLPACT